VTSIVDGDLHSSTCEDCVDGIVQRGDITTLEVAGDGLTGSLAWNAGPAVVKAHFEQAGTRVVDVTRSVLDKYGTIEWTVTFTKNVGTSPPGSGDVDPINVVQGADTSGRSANVVMNEVVKGSDGLAGTFTLDYQSSGGPRTFSFDESPERMMRKLEEMSTIGNVFVARDCYPSCSSGGWGGTAVVPGTSGGLQWTIHFVKNPGSNEGFTFPDGSGAVYPPAIDHTLLLGKDATVAMESIEGSAPLTGSFSLNINGESTETIPYNIDGLAMEHTINDLQSVGDVSVESGMQTNHPIEGITASVHMDGTVASISGGDLRQHLAPGDSFRIGGSTDEIDSAEVVGSASLSPLSPILSNVQLDTRSHLNVRETIRIGGDTYSIARNGIEVQQIAVHRASDVSDGDFYQLKVAIDGVEQTTACSTFDASASEVETALNSLSILLDNGGVEVTKTDTSSGFVGDAHFYKVYFSGVQLVGDVQEMVAEQCATGIAPEIDSTNSHVYVRTVYNGGKTEHQQVTLASDSGSTNDTPAFRLSISDSNTNTWNSPCYSWGVPALGLSSLLDDDSFSSNAFLVDAIVDVGNNQYQIGSIGFVEGVVLVGDYVNVGNRCPGHVLSIEDNGKSLMIESISCTAEAGDDLFVGADVTILDTFTDNGSSVSELSVLTVFSQAEIDSDNGLYKISVEFGGDTRSTSCLTYGASAQEVQQEIGSLFDYNQDGFIDSSDADHITVTRNGDGSSSSGYGYTYEFLSNGSNTVIGPSAVLGSSAPKFSVSNVGVGGGCVDHGVEEALVTDTASTTDESNAISLGSDATIAIHAGDRIRATSSLAPSKVYTVDHTSDDGNTLYLTEDFDGSTTTGTTTLHIIGGGYPQFDVTIERKGVDEYVYDVYFTGSHWKNPQVTVNVFGDDTCSATTSDIVDGMNRHVGVKPITSSDSDRHVLDRVVRRGVSGQHDINVVPSVLTVHSETPEVQQIRVMDDDNASIWGSSGGPSFKLSYGGEDTTCLAYNVLEFDIEDALNSLSSLCPVGLDHCVTVTRNEDSVLAPNGHVYLVYFGPSLADVDELVADTSHVDCTTAFDSAGGEQVVIDTIVEGKSSAGFSANQVSFSGNQRWLGETSSDLPIYRVSGTFWFIDFEESLGNVDLAIDSSELSSNAQASVEPNFFDGLNPDRVVIPNLATGIAYYSRAYSKTSLGLSSPSDIVSAIPSDRPEKLTSLASGHTLNRNEVQSITIAATHQNEVQAVQTSAMAIPEVQEITLQGAEVSDMNSYVFSLRHPEVQVVKWSATSPVTEGSFFLKLSYVDRANSDISGSIVYKEMKTPCIAFDATADDVKRAIETNALLNGLGVNSVGVTRSGNRSYSSDYGYSYKIQFVGGDVRGNVLELTSDLGLAGLDSSGGNTCTAFASSTNDASLEIWTENESQALGTDTPRAEVVVDSNIAIVDGEFQLSATHFGQQLTTECIPWDGTAGDVKAALENLDNVDSVRVDRMDDGVFAHRYIVYFDGNAMHTEGSDSSGFKPVTSFDVANGSCKPLQAYHNNVLLDVTNIPGGIADIWIESKYDGGHTLPGAPTSESSLQISSALTSSLPMVLSGAQVTQSLETSDNGLTFTITYGGDDGDVSLLVCNQSPSLTSLIACDTSTVMDGNEIRGSFYLESSDPIPYDASPAEMEEALRGVSGIGTVQVSRPGPDGQSGYTWLVTFTESGGDVATLNASNSLTGKDATISVTEVTKGNELGGSFTLSFGSESTDTMPFDVDGETLRSALEVLDDIGNVIVSADGSVNSELGRLFTVTFLDKAGDVTSLVPDSHLLTGLGGVVSVSEVTKGSLAAKDTLHMSFDLPQSCSTSDVGRAFCGDSIIEAAVELSPSIDFTGTTTSFKCLPDYSTQIIRTSYTGLSPPQQLVGYFNVVYDGSLSDPINAHASADEVRDALEGLPGIETVSVERDFASKVLPDVCIDATAGSTLVECSSACSPCNFGSKGITANQLVRVGERWYRVSSAYDGIQESFDLSTVGDSLIKTSFVGENSLTEWQLKLWTGGYEWVVSLHSVDGEVKPFSTPAHHMLPHQASIEIATQDCNKCMYVDNLSPDTQYYIRARAKNERGWSEYSDVISETPRAIPSAPTRLHVSPISGECLEVQFDPPVYGEPITSYVVQWDYIDNPAFQNAQGLEAGCSSLRYGSCTISEPGAPPPIKHEICGLVESEEIFVRVAAINGVDPSFRSVAIGDVFSLQTPGDQYTTTIELRHVPSDPTNFAVHWKVDGDVHLDSRYKLEVSTSADFSDDVRAIYLQSS